MKYFLRITLLFLSTCNVLFAQNKDANYWQQKADYDIHVALNDTFHTLDGEVTIAYTNHSPDTLRFLWIHLWPNAYKNDKTAFSEQFLLERHTKFYFSSSQQKGYINRINFTANGKPAATEDHPAYIDVTKLILPEPLAPGKQVVLHTPFHVQLPEMFSRSGHHGQYYAVAQWFPKVAVYDRQGWHPMPYLSAGEFYADFGNYNVAITLPDNYAVAATGELQNEGEKQWLKKRTKPIIVESDKPEKKELFRTKPIVKNPTPASSKKKKTLHYRADNVIDFAWFADKRFVVKFDTVNIDNKTIEVWNYQLPTDEKNWTQSIQYSKRALKFYSSQLGPYPYPQVSVVASPLSEADGMEYPMVTLLNDKSGLRSILDILIAHEIGHNWLQAIVATNERDHAWMDEGINTYYEQLYHQLYYESGQEAKKPSIASKVPDNLMEPMLDLLYSKNIDVPIESAADTVLPAVYYPVAYEKTGQWMKRLESQLGKEKMQHFMHDYYNQWKFKHPNPDDFRLLAEQSNGAGLDEQFSLLHKKGPMPPAVQKKTKITGLFNLGNTKTTKYIGIAPSFGYNNYDKFELGLLIHNYNIPENKFQFVATPMFGTGSKQLVGYGRLSYHWNSNGKISRTEIYSGMAKFNFNDGADMDNNQLLTSFTKFTPGIKIDLRKRNTLSTLQHWIDFKTYFISEQQLKSESPAPPGDTVFYSVRNGSATTVIPQLTIGWNDSRELHPWSIEVGVQQVNQIVRTTFNGNYFLNYNKSGKGFAVRLFAGKIFYTVEKTAQVRSDNSRYHFTMQGPNGWQDYTYSDPFMERNQATSLPGRQIMMRDGGFKYRSDYSSVVPGLKTTGVDYFDNWLLAINTQIDIPDKINPLSILPFDAPLRVFADVGTSASPWQSGSVQAKFLYSIGFHLPILKVLHVYYPIIQSKEFKEPNSVNDPFKAGGPSWWQKYLTFSLDIQSLKPKVEGIQIF